MIRARASSRSGGPPPAPADVANRRASRRHPVHVRIDLLPLLDSPEHLSEGSARSAIALDLGEHGLLCSRAGYLPLGALLRLFMRLPDVPDDPLSCYGRVVRCDLTERPSYGLRLTGLSVEGARRIREFVGRRQKEHPVPPALSWNYRFDA